VTGMPAVGTVAAVITAFDPGESLPRVAASILGQVGMVLVVDDGSTAPGPEAALAGCVALGCTVIRHEANRGIAAALNSGVAQAVSAVPGLRAVITLDQDSDVPAGYVKGAMAAWGNAERDGFRVGMVAPERVEGQPLRVVSHRGGVLLGAEPIQSGLLIPATVLQAVGSFDESLFIDGVDADFYLRCLDAGLVVVIAPGAILLHRLGSRHEISLLGRPLRVRGTQVEVTQSAPFRYYFLLRNRITLVRRHVRRHPRWAAGQVVGLVGHLVLVLTLVPGRGQRARWVLHGIRDGLRGVGGPAPPR